MNDNDWQSNISRPIRRVLALPIRAYGFVLEQMATWMMKRQPEAPVVHCLKLLVPPGPNQNLFLDRLGKALTLLAERSPQTMRAVQREIIAVVVLPRRLPRGGAFASRARIVMLDHVAVWGWNLESLAVEIAGWAVDARLQRAGFGGERYRDRREHRVLLTRVKLGGVLLGMEESAAALLAQAKRERPDSPSSHAAT
jgi:hypothetical protein